MTLQRVSGMQRERRWRAPAGRRPAERAAAKAKTGGRPPPPVAGLFKADAQQRVWEPPERREVTRYANLNFNEPSFSIELTISSPAFNHTCLSLGYPRITPSGVPDQMMSPGSSVHILLI